MFDALYIGATGMQAQQLAVDTIANNLANVNTAGFKRGRVTFTDLVVQEAARVSAGASPGGEAGLLGSIPRLGAGVGMASVTRLFDPGDVKQTGSAWDVAIQGDGFLEVTMPDGSSAFTRGGTLTVNPDGLLATRAGHPLKPGIAIPAEATRLTIGADGTVRYSVPSQAAPVEAGQLEVARFANAGSLTPQPDDLYRANDASGEPMPGMAGEDGVGQLAQGFLEGSNVKLVDEVVSLMVAQRAYEASVRVVQASDEMLGMVNNLRR